MNEEHKTTYLVGHPDSEVLDIYEAATPQEAAELYKLDYFGEDYEPAISLAVWTAIECRPEIDLKEAFNYWGSPTQINPHWKNLGLHTSDQLNYGNFNPVLMLWLRKSSPRTTRQTKKCIGRSNRDQHIYWPRVGRVLHNTKSVVWVH